MHSSLLEICRDCVPTFVTGSIASLREQIFAESWSVSHPSNPFFQPFVRAWAPWPICNLQPFVIPSDWWQGPYGKERHFDTHCEEKCVYFFVLLPHLFWQFGQGIFSVQKNARSCVMNRIFGGHLAKKHPVEARTWQARSKVFYEADFCGCRT